MGGDCPMRFVVALGPPILVDDEVPAIERGGLR
jgi:hypothetical protein